MPLYEYRCSTCGKTLEVIQKFSDAPLEVHEDCGGKLEKLVSTSALKFKGSGWYVNDYAKASSSRSEGEKKSEKTSDTKSESSSDSKPAETKTESKPASPAKSES